MKQRKIIFILSSLLVLNFTFQNCAKKKKTESSLQASEQEIMEQKSMAIINEKCASCHTGAAALSNAAGTNDPITAITDLDYLLRTRLIIAGEPDLSPLFQSIQGADMPPGQPLSLNEVTILKDWITNFNKEEVTTGTTSAPIPLAANFQSLRANVFLKKCYTCHINRTIKLDTYASVSGAINTNNLRTRVNNGIMPPATAAQLTGEEKTLLLQWIDAGALNN
jgi:uncharacterized membrane protein